MTYEERLQHVTVLGAAGKMGSGILLLTAVEMADLGLKPENKGKSFVLNAVDVSDEALAGLMRNMKTQVSKMAEKKAVQLRKVYADRKDLIENSEIIDLIPLFDNKLFTLEVHFAITWVIGADIEFILRVRKILSDSRQIILMP